MPVCRKGRDIFCEKQRRSPIKTISAAVGRQSLELCSSRWSCLDLDSGWGSMATTTQLVIFLPPGPPPCQGCCCLHIWWLHGDLRGTIASTTLSYDGITGWITNCSAEIPFHYHNQRISRRSVLYQDLFSLIF